MRRFEDRNEAGRMLAADLAKRSYERPVVLGIPRGGVPVAIEVARVLGGELGVVVARKLGAPGYAELAIGATTASGASYVNSEIAEEVGATDEYIAAETTRQVLEAQRREQLFDGRRRPNLKGRVVLVVDDGIATGATAIAAVRAVKAEGASKVVLAVPVGPPQTIERLRAEADEVVCLNEDENFGAVGEFYVDFAPVSDDEVVSLLESASPRTEASIERRVEVKRDGVRLVASLTTPGGPGPFPLVIFVHGLGSGKDSPRNVVIATRLQDAGFATLLFDLSGHGESSIDPEDGMDAYVQDTEAMFAWAIEQPEIDKDAIGIAGSSMGATIAAQAQAQGRVTPQTMVLRAPPMEAQEFRGVRVPSLVLVGSHDPLRFDAERGVAGCPELTLSVVEGASHLFEEPGTLEQALEATVGWFRTHLMQAQPDRGRSRSGG
ncbi:MAG TPA: alpha/beta fold hydrolase [Dehalococcoidia bacterium]|nr:alpha/beta fold hydrolase [Dehalococcoidia bacterium]